MRSEESTVRGQSWSYLDAWSEGYATRYEEFVMAKRSLVSVVDDDESVRESLPDLLREFGFAVAGVLVGRRVPRVQLRLPDQVSDPRRRHAWDERPGSPTGIDAVAGRRYRSSSSPLTETKPFVRTYSNRAPWNACSSHSATRLCVRRSMPRFERAERRAHALAREGI